MAYINSFNSLKMQLVCTQPYHVNQMRAVKPAARWHRIITATQLRWGTAKLSGLVRSIRYQSGVGQVPIRNIIGWGVHLDNDCIIERRRRSGACQHSYAKAKMVNIFHVRGASLRLAWFELCLWVLRNKNMLCQRDKLRIRLYMKDTDLCALQSNKNVYVI